jgi:preprotein translocase subunit SecG
MITLITIVHIIVCLFIIIVVLLQSGDLTKATTWSAVIFMVTSITLSIFVVRRSGQSTSVLSNVKSDTTKTQPVKPAQQPAAPAQK